MKIQESIFIAADRTRVFDYTQDYAHRLEWDTFLKRAELIGASNAAKGVKAWCVSRHGMGMETEYVSFNRPQVTAIKMTRGPFAIKSFAGSWRFDERENGTLVTFTYSIQFIFPLSVASFLLAPVLRKNVRARLCDLKRCMELPVL